MSHNINTTIGFAYADRNIKTALKKYFEPGSYDLSYQAIMPPPDGLYGEQLAVWKSEHWGSRPWTFEAAIKDNKLRFYTLNGIPWKVYAALAKRLQVSLLVTTASTDDMEWTQREIRRDGQFYLVYGANEQHSEGPVPARIRELLATYEAISAPQEPKPEAQPYIHTSVEPNSQLIDQEVPF